MIKQLFQKRRRFTPISVNKQKQESNQDLGLDFETYTCIQAHNHTNKEEEKNALTQLFCVVAASRGQWIKRKH